MYLTVKWYFIFVLTTRKHRAGITGWSESLRESLLSIHILTFLQHPLHCAPLFEIISSHFLIFLYILLLVFHLNPLLVLGAKSCPILLCNLMLLQPSRFLSVHEIFQAEILEWVTASFSKASFVGRGYLPWVLSSSCLVLTAFHPKHFSGLCLWQETLRDEMSSRSRLAHWLRKQWFQLSVPLQWWCLLTACPASIQAPGTWALKELCAYTHTHAKLLSCKPSGILPLTQESRSSPSALDSNG